MLKPFKPKPAVPRTLILWGGVALLVIAGIVTLIISFSSSKNDTKDDVNAVYTNAAETVAAQQLTLQAASPSATLELFTPTATMTVPPAATPTLFVQSPVATNTSSSGVSGAVGCYNSAYVSDVTFPDNTAVTAGQTFTKKWKLQNNGTCPWTATFKAAFVSGNAMGGVPAPLGISVDPGNSADISVDMTAPSTSGNATGYWILVNDNGQKFGTTFYVLVTVGGTSTTGTVAVTVTGTPPTATATGTSSIPVPSAANNPDITLTCTLGGTGGTQYEYKGKLTWEDTSNNESGFNIYINGALSAVAPANTTSYNVPGVFYDAGTVVTYSVEAFNAVGKASQANVTRQCP